MQFSTVAASLLLAGSALAQAPASAPGQVMVQTVKVGGANGELTFSPSDIQAPVGSMVQFQFWPKNHSVAQSSFAQPCMPITQAMPNVTQMFWSGFMPTDANSSMMATYTIMINNTTPIWLYCAQATHCQKGMVAAINAVNSTGKTVDAYAQLAAKASANIAPGSSNATDGTTGSSSSGSGSASPTDSSGSGSPSGTSPAAASGTGNTKAASIASGISVSSQSLALAAGLSILASFVL